MDYSVGDLAVLTATFKDASGNATDPTTITFKIKDPNGGTITTLTPTKQATGVYYYEQSCTDPGTWMWRATGTGAAQASADAAFQVLNPTF